MKKKRNKYRFGTFYQLSPGNVEQDLDRFNSSISDDIGNADCCGIGESIDLYGDQMNLIEKLNNLDIKALDNGEYLDLRNMYEAIAPRMSAQTKTELKNLLSTTDDYDAVNSFLQTKMQKNEDLEEDLEYIDDIKEAIGSAAEFIFNYEGPRRVEKIFSDYGLHPDDEYIFQDNESENDLRYAFRDLEEYLNRYINSHSVDNMYGVDNYFNIEQYKSESLHEDLFIMAVPSVEDFACSVIAAYQNATKWLDTIKEMIYHDHSCVFFSDYIHRLAHSMPERFDKFGDILHTGDIKIEYPETKELEDVPSTPEEAIDKVIEILNAIKGSLNNFIKCTDENNHGMACSTEDLLMDIDKEYTPLFRMKKALENCDGDYASFDKWVHQYVDNKDKLTESLNEKLKYKHGSFEDPLSYDDIINNKIYINDIYYFEKDGNVYNLEYEHAFGYQCEIGKCYIDVDESSGDEVIMIKGIKFYRLKGYTSEHQEQIIDSINDYISNTQKTESLTESINKGTINKSLDYLESNGFEVETSNDTLNQFNIKTPDKTELCLAFFKGKDYFLIYGANGHKYPYPYDTTLYSYSDIVDWVADIKEYEDIDGVTESLNESEDSYDDYSIIDKFFDDIENNSISGTDLSRIIPEEDNILDELNPSVVSKGYSDKTYGPPEDCYVGEGPEFDVDYSDFRKIMIDIFTDGLCSYYKCEDRSKVEKEVARNIIELEELCDTSIYDDNSLYDYLCDHYLDDDDYDWEE